MILFERGLGIEAVDGREPAVHEEKDDALDFLRVVEVGDADVTTGIEDSTRTGERSD